MTAAETQRVWWAIVLSRDVETCCSLLRGEPVDEASLDQLVLRQARRRRLVTLCRAADLFAIAGERRRA